MSRTDRETLNKIHEAAEKEFLEKGFKDASLRNIVKTVGVTTGAFYGYYKSKEELYEALVGPVAEYYLNRFQESLENFSSLPPEKQKETMGNYSENFAVEGITFAYANAIRMKLLLTASAGTKYENFVHELVELEIESTHRFMECMEEAGMSRMKINPYFEHTIISGMYNSMFELVIHEVPYEEALECAKAICRFYGAGWSACMGL